MEAGDAEEFSDRVLGDLWITIDRLPGEISALLESGRVGPRFWYTFKRDLHDLLDRVDEEIRPEADDEIRRVYAVFPQELEAMFVEEFE